MKKIMIINGVNLNMLGIREKGIYGSLDYASLCDYIAKKCNALDVKLDFFQSNCEGEIVTQLHKCYFDKYDGAVINPGAHTHYSYAIYDAIKAIAPIPVVEVHISDIRSREDFRKISITAPACVEQIAGLGYDGYVEAVKLLADMKK